ncbi:hypothetical protein L1887_10957 [Cichorium endivia]|nr:hypothetical protein L1887_10957 [Cichorium endivia]
MDFVFDSLYLVYLMFHGKAKRLVKNRKYGDAVKVLAMGEEAFSVCDLKVVEKDSFMEISFHIPNDNTQLGTRGKEVVATFEGIAILTPRLVIPLDLAVIGNQFHSDLGLLDTAIGMWQLLFEEKEWPLARHNKAISRTNTEAIKRTASNTDPIFVSFSVSSPVPGLRLHDRPSSTTCFAHVPPALLSPLPFLATSIELRIVEKKKIQLSAGTLSDKISDYYSGEQPTPKKPFMILRFESPKAIFDPNASSSTHANTSCFSL